MMELASSIIWYVHTEVPRRYISSDSGLNFQIQPVALDRSPVNGNILNPPSPPHIQPQYYAAIIAAEAIGNTNDTQVIELDFDDTRISGYAFYQSGQLKKAILINSQAFYSTTTTERSNKHVDLTFDESGSVPLEMDVKRLSVQSVQFFYFNFLMLIEKLGTRMILRVWHGAGKLTRQAMLELAAVWKSALLMLRMVLIFRRPRWLCWHFGAEYWVLALSGGLWADTRRPCHLSRYSHINENVTVTSGD